MYTAPVLPSASRDCTDLDLLTPAVTPAVVFPFKSSTSLVPRPSPAPVFDRLQYAKTELSFCILQAIKNRSRGRPGNEASHPPQCYVIPKEVELTTNYDITVQKRGWGSLVVMSMRLRAYSKHSFKLSD